MSEPQDPTQEQIRAAQLEQIRASQKVISSYQALFNSPEGKIVLADLEKSHWLLASTFSNDSSDMVIFREGQRNVVLRIKAILETDPKKLDERMKHASEE